MKPPPPLPNARGKLERSRSQSTARPGLFYAALSSRLIVYVKKIKNKNGNVSVENWNFASINDHFADIVITVFFVVVVVDGIHARHSTTPPHPQTPHLSIFKTRNVEKQKESNKEGLIVIDEKEATDSRGAARA